MSDLTVDFTDVVRVVDVQIAGGGGDERIADLINDEIERVAMAMRDGRDRYVAPHVTAVKGHVAHITILPYADNRKAKVFLTFRFAVTSRVD